MDVAVVRSDLIDKAGTLLIKLFQALGVTDWDLDTASPGWSVADQIAHLAYFDNAAALAIANPDEFQESVQRLLGDVFPW
ncbi:MAG: hypothetical protein Ct9H90mP5_03590 [Acidimicrobiaceae bacterium]|nr:MAG: hypothetical protein Ct9H90mP5_03590 [Acidimicrobiaceae bacterium]